MRRPVLFTILFCLFVACGGGAEKEAFERYERSVAKLLEREAELRARYDEELKNATAYGNDEAFQDLIRSKVVPFYTEMQNEVAALVPEDEALRAIHSNLTEYAVVRRAFFETDKQSAAINALEKPILEKLALATKAREKKTLAFNKALGAAPEVMNKLTPLFGDEGSAINALFTNLEAMRGGKVQPASFLDFIDSKLSPFYDQVDQGLAALDLGESGTEVIRTAKEYLAATRTVIDIARELALGLKPIQERFANLATRADELMETYRSSAKAYRDSLR